MDQNQQPSTSKTRIVTIGTLIAVVLLGVLIIRNYAPGGGNVSNLKPVAVQATSVMSAPQAAYSISGIVKKVSPKQVFFETNSLDIRTANITNTTKVIRMLPRDPQEVQKENEEFMKFMQNPATSGSTVIPPTPNTAPEKEVVLSDIKVGDRIVVATTVDTENLKEFAAVEIRILAE